MSKKKKKKKKKEGGEEEERGGGEEEEEEEEKKNPKIFVHHHHHHLHHHHVAFRVLGLLNCSGPMSSLEVFGGVVLGFISHTVHISQLSVAVCLSQSVSVHSPNMLYPFIYFCNLDFL